MKSDWSGSSNTDQTTALENCSIASIGLNSPLSHYNSEIEVMARIWNVAACADA
jgi:hypothetical protein